MGFRFNPVDVLLFLSALSLARRAQRVRQLPVQEVVEDIANRGGRGRGHPIQRVELAAVRASNRWSRWFGGIDTCLIRSMILGGLLTGGKDVILNIGFRPGDEGPSIDGHAWLTVDGNPVGSDGVLARERYTRVLTVSFLRGPGEK